MGVICAAFLCSIVTAVGGAGQGTRRLICGVFLALALLHPLGSLELPELSLDPILEEAEEAAANGTAQAETARNAIITDSLEAYILTKATELDLVIGVEVEVDSDGLPISVTLTGGASPSERDALTNAITTALGLGKEEIRWKQTYQSSE